MSYKKYLTVKEDDLDDLEHVNNVRYVQWIQDVSKEHWKTLAPQSMQEGIVWVVLNHNITYKNAAKLHDPIRIETHIANAGGATSLRIVDIFNDKTQQSLVHAETNWCLLNADTLKPMRIPQDVKNMFDKSIQGRQ